MLISLSSENILPSLKVSIFYIRFGVFCILVKYLISEDKKFVNYFFYVLIFSIIIISFDAYIQYFNGSNILGFKAEGSRISGMFGDELILGSYLARILPLTLAFFFLKKFTLKSSLVLFFLIIFVEIVVIITGERTAIGLITLSTIIFLIFANNIKMLRLICFALVLFITFIIFSSNPTTKNRILEDTMMELGISENKQIQLNFEGVDPILGDFYLFSPKHQSMIITSFNMFRDKLIFGHGPKSFRYKCEDKKYSHNKWGCSTHPHNNLSQLLSETGLLGFCFYLTIIIYFVKNLFKDLKLKLKKKEYYNNYQICLIVSIILSLWPLIPSGNIFNNWISIVFYLPVGFYLNSINNKSNASNNF